MTDYAELAQKLKPYIVPWLGGSGGGAGTAGGSLAAHALSGPQHTGLLAQGQAPWAATAAALNAHIANPNAHHARLHNVVSATDHQIAGNRWSVLGATADNTLGLLLAAYDVSAGLSALLRSEGGDLLLRQLQANNVLGVVRVRTPLLDTASGDLSIAPAGKALLNAGSWTELPDGKTLRTNGFTSGFAGAGMRLDQGVGESGKTSFELDNLWVRGRMHIYELLIHQIRATNGSIFVSSVGKVTAITDNGGGSYTFTCEAGHGFAGGDIIRAQRWNAASSSLYQTNMHVSYSPTPTLTTFTASLQSGTTPALGMEFVRLGNLSVTNRRGGIYMTADDSGAPFLDIFDGVDSLSAWNTPGVVKVRLGNLNGVGDYSANVYGFMAGNSAGTWLSADASYGFRVMRGSLARLHLTTVGDLVIRNGSGSDVIRLDNDGASYFAGRMTIGNNGEIVQGSGTKGTAGSWPVSSAWGTFTGLRLGNDGTVGRIGGYNAGALQWYGATDGTLRFGGYDAYNNYTGILDDDGVTVFAGPDETSQRNGYRGTVDTQLMGGLYFVRDFISRPPSGPFVWPPIPYMYTLLEARPVTLPSGWWGGATTYAARLQLMAVGDATYEGTVGIFARGAADTGMYVSAYAGAITSYIADSEQMALSANLLELLGSAPTLNVGSAAISTGAASVQVGHARTGNGYALLDLIGDASYHDYGVRILRGNTGANAVSQILHRGTGNFAIQATEAAALLFQTAATTRMTIESTGNVDVVNELRAYVLRLDSSGAQSGVAGTITFGNEAYTGSFGTNTGTVRMVSGATRDNGCFVKMYVGTQVVWIPGWYSIT